MDEVQDIKSYLANCRINENVSSALNTVFQQPILPYNPYASLLEKFLANSEYYVMAKSHLQLGAKILKKNEVTRIGSLYKSPSDVDPPIWGLQNVLKCVNYSKITEMVNCGLESVCIPGDAKFAVSLVAPSCFHKSILGNVKNEINLHIDIVCTDESTDKVVSKFARAIQSDFLQDTDSCVPLLLQIVGSNPALFTEENFSLAMLQDLLPSSSKIQSIQMFKYSGQFIKISKSYTVFRVWKRLGKLFTTSIGTPPLLNLLNGVVISAVGAELYESTLLQSSLLQQDVAANKNLQNPGSKNTTVLLSRKHPLVVSNARAVRDQFVSSSSNLDIVRFAQGILWDYLLSPNDSTDLEGTLQDIFSLHRSSAVKFYNLSLRYKALETYFLYSKENADEVTKSVSTALGDISATLNDISYKLPCAPIQKWYAQVLENNVYILEGMLHDKSQYHNIPAILGVEKVSCRVAALFFLPHALRSLESLSAELEKSRDVSHLTVQDNVSARIPVPDNEIGFYETAMNKLHEFGIDLKKNAAKIQSAANMHTIAVLLQYQSDMYMDTTLENVINSISSDFPVNPYREFVTECLLSSYRVETGCITENSIISLFRHRPKLRSAEHHIFCIEDNIFGLAHSISLVDPEGLDFVLSVCKTVENNPFITKKDGVRIMHTCFPYAEHLVCGRLRPMIYTIKCEEYYVMIKETKSADADIGLNFLVEMIYLHLVDMSKNHIVIGYSVEDSGDVILLDMNKIQARQSEKSALISELHEAIQDRSQLSVQFFVCTDLGHYIKVIKDIKPIYADQSAELYDHYTPCNPLNANFAVFSKLSPANFFYDYAEGTFDEDLQFVLEQLNRAIVDQSEDWSVYQTIQLKHMLKGDDRFIPSAFFMAHSSCSRLRGLQELNETISDVMSLSEKVGAQVDTSIVREMVLDLVIHSKETLKNIGVGELLSEYVETFLRNIYNGGDPVLDETLEKSLKSLFIIFSSLAQYFEKEFTKSSCYKLQSFVVEASAELKQ